MCEMFLFLSIQNKLLNKMEESLFFTLASFRNPNQGLNLQAYLRDRRLNQAVLEELLIM